MPQWRSDAYLAEAMKGGSFNKKQSMGCWVDAPACSLCEPKAASADLDALTEEVRALRDDLRALLHPHPLLPKAGEFEKLARAWKRQAQASRG